MTGETITISVETRILESVTASIVSNIATLDICDCTAQADVILVAGLPETGESPWWRLLILVLGIGSASIVSTLFAIHWRRQYAQ